MGLDTSKQLGKQHKPLKDPKLKQLPSIHLVEGPPVSAIPMDRQRGHHQTILDEHELHDLALVPEESVAREDEQVEPEKREWRGYGRQRRKCVLIEVLVACLIVVGLVVGTVIGTRMSERARRSYY